MKHSLRSLLSLVVGLMWLVLLPAGATPRPDLETDLMTFTRVLSRLDYSYVEEVNTDTLTEVAIRAMLKELDPHTSYLSPREVAEMQEGLGGSFEGIGVSYQMVDDTLLVIHPTPDGPSQRAGIQPGDQIVSVADSSIAGQHLTTDQIKNRLRGPRGSVAHLGVLRPGLADTLRFDVKRDRIPVLSVQTYYMLNDHVGYIFVERFAQNTAHEVAQAVDELAGQGMRDLIIDLQGNGGGYLSAAVDMAGFFLPRGSSVVYTQGRREERREYSTPLFQRPFEGRLAVLIDEQSASASEIFAGAVQDHDRGIILGRRSYGKGLVQRPVELPNGGMVRLTVSHYYTPSGRCIQKPYVKGQQQDYKRDLLKRMESGELQSADSIHLVDSVCYYTDRGRVVYGGGGIVPDVFVPLDTTRLAPAHRAVIARGTIHRFMLSYFRQQRARLTTAFPTIEAFTDPRSGYQLPDSVVTQVLDQARRDSVQAEDLDSLVHNDLFRQQCLAYLANNLYDTGAYRRVMNQSALPVERALGLLDDDNYDAYLRPAPKASSKR